MKIPSILPMLAMPLMLLIVEIGAIMLSLPMQDAGLSAFEDPS